MNAPHDETAIRLAMIAAGYGDGFAVNLDASRLRDYATHPDVARHLAALSPEPSPDPELNAARLAYDAAVSAGMLADLAARATVLVDALEAALTEARAPRVVHVLVVDGEDDYTVTAHPTYEAAEAALQAEHGTEETDAAECPLAEWMQDHGTEVNISAVIV